MSDFKSQKEIWKYLIEGGKVEYKNSGLVFSFTSPNKSITNQYGDSYRGVSFADFANFKKHIEPVYEWQWAYRCKNVVLAEISFFYKSEKEFLVKMDNQDLEWYKRIEESKREVKS